MRRDRGSKLRFLLPLLGPLKISGNTKNLPKGGVLVIVNHSSRIDTLIFYIVLRKEFGRKVVFMAKAELWKIPILGFFLTRRGFIPVYRESDNPAACLIPAEGALDSGLIVVIYPEGGNFSWMEPKDQPPSKFKTGAARLWARTGVPVLPLAQLGARRVMYGKWQALKLLTAWWRRFFYFRKRGKIQLRVHFGNLITQSATGNVRGDTKFLLDAVVLAFEEARARS